MFLKEGPLVLGLYEWLSILGTGKGKAIQLRSQLPSQLHSLGAPFYERTICFLLVTVYLKGRLQMKWAVTPTTAQAANVTSLSHLLPLLHRHNDRYLGKLVQWGLQRRLSS